MDTDLSMAGYTGERVPAMQKRMLEALETIPGVESVGLSNNVPLGDGSEETTVFTETTTDLRPANASARPLIYLVSPGYFHAAGTAMLSGRDFNWHDDENAPRVAVVNPEFARRIFGSAEQCGRRHLQTPRRDASAGGRDRGTREIRKPHRRSGPRDFPSDPAIAVQHDMDGGALRTRSGVALGAAIRLRLRALDAGLPVYVQTRVGEMDPILFGPRMATLALGVMGLMGAMLAITGVFGMAAYSVSKRLRELGIRIALGAQRREVCGRRWGGLSNCWRSGRWPG